MTDRFARCFEQLKQEKRAALVTYTMAYDPNYEHSLEILCGLPEAGADIIELGMPFSDPVAEGPPIQRAALRALRSGGTTAKTLDMVRSFRGRNDSTPIVLMGYYNPVYHYGLEAFVADAVDAGVDGVILVDLPPEEEQEFTDIAKPAGLSLIKLTTPTTDAVRAPKILHNASGFVYYVSVAGVTGTKSAAAADIGQAVEGLRAHTDLPICVGFGIRTPDQAEKVAKLADGVVVGSAFADLIHEHVDNPDQAVEAVLERTRALSAVMGR